jgi:hypothetical protein
MLKKLAFLSTVVALALPAFAEDYVIKFSRPMNAGDQFAFHGTWRDEHAQQSAGRPPHLAKRSIDVEADMTVIEPSRFGLPLDESFTIRKCTALMDGKPVDCPPPGTVIELKSNGASQEVTAKGATLSPDAQKLLESVFPNTREADLDIDLPFGAKEPKRPGDVWPVNKEELAKLFGALGTTVDPATIKGNMTFTQSLDPNNQKILRTIGKYTIANLPTPVPPGEKILSSLTDTTDIMEMPVDPAPPILSDAETIHSTLQISLHTLGGPTLVRSNVLVNVLRQYKPLKPPAPSITNPQK